MNGTAGGAPPITWRRLAPVRLAALGAVCLLHGACGSSQPPGLYMLGTAPAPVVGAAPQAGLQVVEVKPVGVPDYLDTTDLLVRHGGSQMVPSPTGRWGERLSAGVTRALAAGLAARLPRMAVTATPPVERQARQVLVDIESFEARADGKTVLVARWTITDGGARQTLASERVSLTERMAGTGDAAVVAAMTGVTEQLADRIAAALERTSAAARGRR